MGVCMSVCGWGGVCLVFACMCVCGVCLRVIHRCGIAREENQNSIPDGKTMGTWYWTRGT